MDTQRVEFARTVRNGRVINTRLAVEDDNVRQTSADSVLSAAPDYMMSGGRYAAAAFTMTMNVLDVTEVASRLQDASALYYAGSDMTIDTFAE